jgi:hypothetical protein
MMNMFFSDVFDGKVVYHQGKCDWTSGMAPEAGCVSALVIAVLSESFCYIYRPNSGIPP